MICAGRITSIHGVKGCVRFQSYMDGDFKFPGVEAFIGGASYVVMGAFNRKFPMVVLTLSRVDSACKAQELIGLDVFVPEALCPALQEGEYYYKDLVGLAVYCSGVHIGSVSMLYDFGAAAEVLEVLLLSGKKAMLPFTEECVIDVNLASKTIEVVFPQEI